jgi:preprotein translocase subunit SecD
MRALVVFAGEGREPSPALAVAGRGPLAERLRLLSEEPHMSRPRKVWTVAVLVALVSGAALRLVAALPLLPPGQQDARPSPRLEIRLAELEPAAGLTPARVPGAERPIFLHPAPVATSVDVTSAAVEGGEGPSFSVGVVFSSEAAERMTRLTRDHVGRPLAILIDGRVVTAPIVRSAVGDRALLTGDFTRGEAEALAAGLAPAPESR